jgi:SagB-type dehydrogenase family enzyme
VNLSDEPAGRRPGDTARLYHRLSSYTFWPEGGMPAPIPHDLVLQDFVPEDRSRLPPHWKVYPPSLPRIDLPRDWARPAVSMTDALSGRMPGRPQPLDVAGLSRLLHLSAGVVRVRAAMPPYAFMWPFRAAGSAGGRFPLEVYVAARGVDGLDDGVWWYEPEHHGLVRIAPAPSGEATALIVTGAPWRTAWRYVERGFRHVYWDAGSMLAQTLVGAGSAGWAPRLWTRFSDAEVARLVGADGIQEWPVALVALGPGAPALQSGGAAERGSIAEEPTTFPLVTIAQHAGDLDALGDPWRVPLPVEGAVPVSDDVDAVVLRRGSARTLDPTGVVPGDEYRFSMQVALRGIDTPHVVAVHAVDGVEPGLYRPPDLETPVRAGDLRDELLSVCLDMDLSKDASYDVIGAVDLDAIDDRAYREAQLASGIVEGRLHLAAYALGHGASGMTFADDEMERLLAPAFPGRSMGGLLVTCVGVTEYANRPGGMPGDPATIHLVQQRSTPRPT